MSSSLPTITADERPLAGCERSSARAAGIQPVAHEEKNDARHQEEEFRLHVAVPYTDVETVEQDEQSQDLQQLREVEHGVLLQECNQGDAQPSVARWRRVPLRPGSGHEAGAYVICCNETAGAVYDRRRARRQRRTHLRLQRIAGRSIPHPAWIAAAIALGVTMGPAGPARAGEGIGWWDSQRKGANCQSSRVEATYWRAASAAGIEFVRLAPDGWKAAGRDFLIGNADRFEALPQADVAELRRVLDDAQAADVRVVLTMFSLPGARWKQNNGDRDDARLWHEAPYQVQAAAFWRQLAARLHDHPAIAGYDPLNEPHPERAFGYESPDDTDFVAWSDSAAGTPADLDAFNRSIVAAIRAADPTTPIFLEGGFHANPEGLARLLPLDDPAVLYSFHFYEPWNYTTFRVNRGRYAYPGRMPGGWDGPTSAWTAEELHARVRCVVEWQRTHDVPSRRVAALEFGVDRRVDGAQAYLQDLVATLNSNDWHWAFYAFRQDGAWGGMDYELGTGPQDPRIWDAESRGEPVERFKKRRDNPLWRVLAREFRPRR